MFHRIDIYIKTFKGNRVHWVWVDCTRMYKTLKAAALRYSENDKVAIENIKCKFSDCSAY